MERNQTRLSELAISDRKDFIYQINVVNLQSDGFTETQPRDGEKTKKAVVRPPGPIMSPVPRCAQKPPYFLVTIYVGTGPWIFVAEQVWLWNFCARIKDRGIFSQSTYHGESPIRSALSLLCPVKSQARRDIRTFSLLSEGNESRQCCNLVSHLVSKAATQVEIVCQCLSEVPHSPPPGQRRASGRRAPRSTFV